MASRAGLSSVKRSGKAGGNHPILRHGVDVAGQDGDPFSEITLRFAINRPNRFDDGFAISGGFGGAFGARYTRVNWMSFGHGAVSVSSASGPYTDCNGVCSEQRLVCATADLHTVSHDGGNTAEGAMHGVDHVDLLCCVDFSKVGKPLPGADGIILMSAASGSSVLAAC